MSLIRATAVLIFVSLSVTPACAQLENCQHRTLTVSTGSTDGSSVPLLDNANFEGTIGKKSIHVNSAVMNREPVRVILLLDISGSMQGLITGHEDNYSVELARDLVANMPPESAIGLGFFYTELVPVLRPTSDRKALKFQLEGLRSHPESLRGKTALLDAVLGSVKMFDHPQPGDVIYVITDGADNASRITTNHVSQTLAEAGIRLFAYAFQNVQRTVGKELGPGFLQQVVRDTGGTIVVHMSWGVGSLQLRGPPTLIDKSGKLTQLGSSLGSQYRQMANFYQINFDLPETLKKPREWKLGVAGFEKFQREHIVLTYPHMLTACH
jgi:hypothetical protein